MAAGCTTEICFASQKTAEVAAVFQKLRDLIVVQGGVERNSGTAGGNDSQVGGDPARVVIGENGETRTAGKLLFRDPATHRFGHASNFRVRTTFEVVVALEFKRNIVGPALGAFDKAIVERGHWSWRIYTKSALDRSVRALTVRVFTNFRACAGRTLQGAGRIIDSKRFQRVTKASSWKLAPAPPSRSLCETPLRRSR